VRHEPVSAGVGVARQATSVGAIRADQAARAASIAASCCLDGHPSGCLVGGVGPPSPYRSRDHDTAGDGRRHRRDSVSAACGL